MRACGRNAGSCLGSSAGIVAAGRSGTGRLGGRDLRKKSGRLLDRCTMAYSLRWSRRIGHGPPRFRSSTRQSRRHQGLGRRNCHLVYTRDAPEPTARARGPPSSDLQLHGTYPHTGRVAAGEAAHAKLAATSAGTAATAMTSSSTPAAREMVSTREPEVVSKMAEALHRGHLRGVPQPPNSSGPHRMRPSQSGPDQLMDVRSLSAPSLGTRGGLARGRSGPDPVESQPGPVAGGPRQPRSRWLPWRPRRPTRSPTWSLLLPQRGSPRQFRGKGGGRPRTSGSS
jgi:hypothetical protein